MGDGHGRDSLEEIGKRIKREMDASSSPNKNNNNNNNALQQMGNRRVSATVLNTITPCAACKLLRRRCAEECPFSPYFSPHEPQKFATVHKVFGASNVSKMLQEVAEGQRADAANSLVYEANVRLRDPVYGCMGAILTLQRQVQALQAELDAVRAEIIKYSLLHSTTTTATVAPTTPPLVSVIGSPSPAASALYTPPSSATGGYSSLSGDSVAYFD